MALVLNIFSQLDSDVDIFTKFRKQIGSLQNFHYSDISILFFLFVFSQVLRIIGQWPV